MFQLELTWFIHEVLFSVYNIWLINHLVLPENVWWLFFTINQHQSLDSIGSPTLHYITHQAGEDTNTLLYSTSGHIILFNFLSPVNMQRHVQAQISNTCLCWRCYLLFPQYWWSPWIPKKWAWLPGLIKPLFLMYRTCTVTKFPHPELLYSV